MRDSHRAEAEAAVGSGPWRKRYGAPAGGPTGTCCSARARGALDAMGAERGRGVRGVHAGAATRRRPGRSPSGSGSAGGRLEPPSWSPALRRRGRLRGGPGARHRARAPRSARGRSSPSSGAAATVVQGRPPSHWPAAHRRAGARSQPGGPEQLRLQWLTALEVRGIRPFLDQQRVLAAVDRRAKQTSGRRRLSGGTDRSAAARRRNVLEQSFGQLPEPRGRSRGGAASWRGSRSGCTRPARRRRRGRPWSCCTARPAAGRTTLAVRAAHAAARTSSAARAWWTCAATAPASRRCPPGTPCCTC